MPRLAKILACTSLFLTAAALAQAAQPPAMPPCDAETRGQIWPPAAGRDPELRKRLARCGKLRICTRGAWRYHWESPTVRVDQLAKDGSLAPPPGCEALGAVPAARTKNHWVNPYWESGFSF